MFKEIKPNIILFCILVIGIILYPPFINPAAFSYKRRFDFLFTNGYGKIDLSFIFVEILLAFIVSILIQKIIDLIKSRKSLK